MNREQMVMLGRQLVPMVVAHNVGYGQKIVWHTFWRQRFMVHVSGTNADHVRQHTIEQAIKMGWTPPKWWQFWRWDDTRIYT